MIFPEDLPHMIDYRLPMKPPLNHGHFITNFIVVHQLPRTPVTYIGSAGNTNACIVNPRYPKHATGWQLPGEIAWRSMEDLPHHWMRFIDRERGTEMDPRPKEDITPKRRMSPHAAQFESLKELKED